VRGIDFFARFSYDQDMKQTTFAMTGFEKHHKTTRREKFLTEMDEIVPWAKLCKVVEPFYPTGEGGRPAIGLERMLRLHFIQQWFTLSDVALEDALYESISLRRFAQIDLGHEPVPDATTLCKFRRLLEEHHLGKEIFIEVNRHLASRGLTVSGGTIVDATIIAAPSSTKNEQKARDPEMHQTKKGNQWYFGAKAHIGVDSRHKLVHSVVVTAANVHDSKVLPELLHGKETRVYGDSAYVGQREVIRKRAPKAKDFTNKRAYRNRPLTEADKDTNRRKSRVRSRCEHVFGTVKGVFGFRKIRYRGIAKNENRLNVLFALANLFTAKKKLLAHSGA
jgi:IS5 family transposase